VYLFTANSLSLSFNDTAEMSREESDGDSCMDLCNSSSDESMSVVTNKLPVKIGLQQKLKIAKGIFGGSTPKRDKIDVCSSSGWEDEVEQIQKRSRRPRNSKVFDQVYNADKDESYFRQPMKPSMLLTVSNHSSDIVNDKEWTECGLFSIMQNKFEAMPLSDVLPAFSSSELSFFTAMKLYNVGDLRRVNINGLSIHLLESLNFRKACAFYAWKDRKPLHDYLRFTVARNTVVKWKKSVTRQKLQSKKDAAKNGSVNKKKDALSIKQIMSPADSTEMEDAEKENTEANDIPLTNLLSNEEACLLRDHFGIDTATQLINANLHIKQRLNRIMAPRFDGRSLQEITCICEGMLYSWLLRSREAVESTESTATSMETETSDSCATISEIYEDPRPNIQTPLSYVDYLFFREAGISTDHELSLIDPSLLSRQYTAFLNTKGKDISYVDANKEFKRLRHEAFLVSSGVSNVINSQQIARIDLAKLPKGVMLDASNLCKTTIDENNSGLPKKTIIVYDDQNNVLYEFSVSIQDSSIPDSGKGAFLTFK